MNRFLFQLAIILMSVLPVQAQAGEPLTLIQTIELPDVPSSPWADHLAVDLKGQRLFGAFPAQKSEVVIDLTKGTVVRNIPIDDPHATLYRSDLDQIYVTDDAGALRV